MAEYKMRYYLLLARLSQLGLLISVPAIYVAIPSERLGLENSVWYAGTSSETTGRVLYQGHGIKVKVTAAKCKVP